jgi:hypothetical protein
MRIDNAPIKMEDVNIDDNDDKDDNDDIEEL